jgi:dihydrodipicolinate synthase/N-acetylneuraminate lyase
MKRYPRCILGTCVVPWDEHGEFQEDLFRHEVRELLGGLTKHLYVFGTAGEGYAVSERQFDRIVKVFHEAMAAGGGQAMVGAISLSLTTIIERIERAREIGVRRFQISLPSWGALTDREMLQFFRETCGRFPDCQFLHYNLMRTKRLVTPADYARLAAEHDNLVATKNSTGDLDRLTGLLDETPQLQHFLTETGFAFGSLLGECGLLISIASTNFTSAHAFFQAAERRDVPQLMTMHRELAELTRELITAVGPEPHIDGAFDKVLWRLHDQRFPLRLLPPYTAATNDASDRLATALRQKCPRWAPG